MQQRSSVDLGAPKKFTLLNRLAVGGMGEVFLARQEGPAGFVKTVAVKRILDSLSGDEGFVKMFLEEARLAARLSHPNIVQVFELGSEQDGYYISMEYIDGKSLHAIKRAVRRGGKKLPVPLVAYVCLQALRGLHYAHALTDEQGTALRIIHRDVTPENILIGFNGVVKLVDFGIAMTSLSAEVAEAQPLKGKIQYLAPELLRGAPASVASDIYSMGVLLFEVLTGRFPFPGQTAGEVITSAVGLKPVSPSKLNSSVPAKLSKAVLRALEKNPAKRQATAAELADDLDDYLLGAKQRLTDVHIAVFLDQVFEGERRLGRAPPTTLFGTKLPRLAPAPVGLFEKLRGKYFPVSAGPAQPSLPITPVPAPVEGVAAEPVAQLVEVRTGRELALRFEMVTLGSAWNNDVVLANPKMPSAAARVQHVGLDRWEVLELTKGAVAVNGSRTARAVLSARDTLTLAGVEFRIVPTGGTICAENKPEPKDKIVPGIVAGLMPFNFYLEDLPPESTDQEEPTVFAELEGTSLPEAPQSSPTRVRVPAMTLQSAYDGGSYEVKPFWIDRTPVTNAGYLEFVEATGESPPSNWHGRRYPTSLEDHPVVGVSLHEARRYAAWRGQRLPTQLEWEAAARGKKNQRFPWGEEWDPSRCHGPDESGTSAVGLLAAGASPSGCLDLLGNVWEWTEIDPSVIEKPEEGYAWVFGGSFCHSCVDNNAIPRRSVNEDKDYLYLGFRCAQGE
ncbi:MAG: protein kinase domain-containing protein [Myxococcaceae bacterium]